MKDQNDNSKLYILNNGNVGIGTTSPANLLDVNGNVDFRGNLDMNGEQMSFLKMIFLKVLN